MTAGAGVLRSDASLSETLHAIDEIAAEVRASGETSPAMAEIRNLLDVGAALVHAARARTESRGNHWRSDHPDLDPALRVRLVQR
jgi:L-aspartate oxidase